MTALHRRKIYDPVLRLIHAWNAFAVLGLLATALLAEAFEHGVLEERAWRIHILAGYALALGLTARLAWGLAGPASARISDMWHPAAWREALRTLRPPQSRRYGHDELASLAYLAVYAALGSLAATGLALASIEHAAGPLSPWLADSAWLKPVLKEPHEALAWVAGGFVLLHLAALFYHQRIERVPTVQSMLTGNQYRPWAHDPTERTIGIPR